MSRFEVRAGGAGRQRAGPEGGNAGAGMWPSSLWDIPACFPAPVWGFLPCPKPECEEGSRIRQPLPGPLPRVTAASIPAAPGERGAAGHEPAGVLPPPLPHLLPAPAGEAAAAEEGKRQAFPQAQRLVQPGGFRVAPTTSELWPPAPASVTHSVLPPPQRTPCPRNLSSTLESVRPPGAPALPRSSVGEGQGGPGPARAAPGFALPPGRGPSTCRKSQEDPWQSGPLPPASGFCLSPKQRDLLFTAYHLPLSCMPSRHACLRTKACTVRTPLPSPSSPLLVSLRLREEGRTRFLLWC